MKYTYDLRTYYACIIIIIIIIFLVVVVSSSWSLSPFAGGTEFLELVRTSVCMWRVRVCVCVRRTLLLGIERNISADATPGLRRVRRPRADDYILAFPPLRAHAAAPVSNVVYLFFSLSFSPSPSRCSLCLIFSVFYLRCASSLLLLLL